VPLFSVIIPTFNRAGLLRQTLESVWSQTFTDYEVIVVDDGSTDETAAYLAQNDDRIAIQTQGNSGPGVARNKGAENARGEYLAFLDSDDLWFPWTLDIVANLINQHDRPALISASMVSFDDPRELESVNNTTAVVDVYTDYFESSDRHCFIGAGMTFVRRDEFLAVGGFSTRQINLEDHDLILRLGTAKGFVRILEPPTLGYRSHDSSSTNEFRKSFEGCRQVIENEQSGRYPGGKLRRAERRKIITGHVRPWVLTLARNGAWRPAWSLYNSTFVWNLTLNRWRFLLGFWANLL
jgi:glycosyltransferase involved in cell wall biosynthesis